MEHGSRSATGIFPRTLTTEQCKDTGLALVLVLLLVALFSFGKDWRVGTRHLVLAAIGVQVLNMIAPRLFHGPAILWFGLSHLLGAVMSRVILTLVFFLLVTPVGLVRRAMGKDPMRRREFKAGSGSVLLERNHTFTAADLTKPF